MISQKRQQTIICVIAGALVLGFIVFRYLPLRQKIKQYKRTKLELGFAIDKASIQNAELPALKKRLEKLQNQVENFGQQIPKQRQLGLFLSQMAALMDEHNLKGQKIYPGNEIETENVKAIPITMECNGKLKQLFEFYKSLQNMERLVRIEEVKLLNAEDFSGNVAMQTKAIIYYKPTTSQGQEI